MNNDSDKVVIQNHEELDDNTDRLLREAVLEAERFVVRAERYFSDAERRQYCDHHNRKLSATKRASLDLSAAVAAWRRQFRERWKR